MLLNRDQKLNPPKTRCIKICPQLYAKPSPFPNFLGRLSENPSEFLDFLADCKRVPAPISDTRSVDLQGQSDKTPATSRSVFDAILLDLHLFEDPVLLKDD